LRDSRGFRVIVLSSGREGCDSVSTVFLKFGYTFTEGYLVWSRTRGLVGGHEGGREKEEERERTE